MHKSGLFSILRTFDENEVRQFTDFLHSPFHNRSNSVVRIFELIIPHYPELNDASLEKECIWSKLYPGKRFNYGIFKNHIFDLNKLVMKFLSISSHISNPMQSMLNISEELMMRGLNEMFAKNHSKAMRSSQDLVQGPDTHYFSLKLGLLDSKIIDYKEADKQDFRRKTEEINTTLDNLHFGYFFLSNYNVVENAKNLNISIDRELYDSVIERYENFKGKDVTTDIFYYTFRACLDPDDPQYYLELKRLFERNQDILSSEAKYDIVIALINYCRGHMLKENKSLLNDLFGYCKLTAEKKLFSFSRKHRMDRNLYMIIVMTALSANEIQWTEQFIPDHGRYLEEDERQRYENFAYVSLYLKMEDFEKALVCLSKISAVDERDKLNIRMFQFKVYYELGYDDQIRLLLDSTLHYLRKDKFHSKESKSGIRDYAILVNRLSIFRSSLTHGKNIAAEIDQLKASIKQSNSLNKNWLLSKAELL